MVSLLCLGVWTTVVNTAEAVGSLSLHGLRTWRACVASHRAVPEGFGSFHTEHSKSQVPEAASLLSLGMQIAQGNFHCVLVVGAVTKAV